MKIVKRVLKRLMFSQLALQFNRNPQLDDDQGFEQAPTAKCPFDASHIMQPKNLLTHIYRCKSPNRYLYIQCRYDPCHWIYPQEKQFHYKQCPTRKQYYSQIDLDDGDWDEEQMIHQLNDKAHLQKIQKRKKKLLKIVALLKNKNKNKIHKKNKSQKEQDISYKPTNPYPDKLQSANLHQQFYKKSSPYFGYNDQNYQFFQNYSPSIPYHGVIKDSQRFESFNYHQQHGFQPNYYQSPINVQNSAQYLQKNGQYLGNRHYDFKCTKPEPQQILQFQPVSDTQGFIKRTFNKKSDSGIQKSLQTNPTNPTYSQLTYHQNNHLSQLPSVQNYHHFYHHQNPINLQKYPPQFNLHTKNSQYYTHTKNFIVSNNFTPFKEMNLNKIKKTSNLIQQPTFQENHQNHKSSKKQKEKKSKHQKKQSQKNSKIKTKGNDFNDLTSRSKRNKKEKQQKYLKEKQAIRKDKNLEGFNQNRLMYGEENLKANMILNSSISTYDFVPFNLSQNMEVSFRNNEQVNMHDQSHFLQMEEMLKILEGKESDYDKKRR